jgi:hypothetical protein
MGVRTDKGRRLAAYLTGHAAIPGITWTGTGISSPYPYRIDVTTSRALENWHDLLRQEHPGIRLAIRYDNTLPDVSHAWTAMSLRDACILLKTHYEERN